MQTSSLLSSHVIVGQRNFACMYAFVKWCVPTTKGYIRRMTVLNWTHIARYLLCRFNYEKGELVDTSRQPSTVLSVRQLLEVSASLTPPPSKKNKEPRK